MTFPISVGRMDWKTPLGLTRVVGKQKNPSWVPPASIRAEHAFDGEELPRIVPAGPDNPLGAYALRLGVAGYLIHGTDKEFGVGMRVTHGCMRLLPEHIEALFRLVPVGTPVRLMNQPIKLGWGPDGLYLEAHPPLEEDEQEVEIRIADALAQARQKLAARPGLALDELAVSTAVIEKSGLPVPITRAK
jgi:L,D-transpeptidase ErfK/SrfK